MTRVNCGIPVKSLTDEHLLAEWREIARIPWYLEKSLSSGSIKKIPAKFTLGTGHVLFFLDKLKFIKNRFNIISQECTDRNINISQYNPFDDFNDTYKKYFNDYSPSQEDKDLVIERISKRIVDSHKKSWRYYHQEISKEQAIELLKRIT